MDYDVIVIGAGPAGSTAASKLAKAGLKTLIIDKSQFPRNKYCGNLISGFCLNELGRSIPKSIIREYIFAANIEYVHKLRVEFEEPIGIFVSRYEFDNVLLNWSIDDGATFMPNAKITAIKDNHNICQVQLQSGEILHSKYIIGADGATSSTGKYIRGKKYNKLEQGYAFVSEIPRDYCSPMIRELENEIYLDVKSISGGYAWIFPQGDIINIGVGSSLLFGKGMRSKFVKYVRARLSDEGYEFKVGAHPLPVGGFPRRVSKNRILLTGDAAGVIDPISGEGIGFAVKSGRLAATAIISTWNGVGNAGRSYRKLFKNKIERELRSLLIYASLLFIMRPIFFSLHPNESKELFKLQFASVAGVIPHSHFVKRALKMLPKLFIKSRCSAFYSKQRLF